MRIATLSLVYVSVYRPTLWFRYFWGCFRLFTSQTCTRFCIQVIAHNIHHSPHLLPSAHVVPWATGCIQARFPFPLSRASSYVYSWHLLYLSLDGVIPEAFIYVYIPYNISCVSSIDRTGDKVYKICHFWHLRCNGRSIFCGVVSPTSYMIYNRPGLHRGSWGWGKRHRFETKESLLVIPVAKELLSLL